MVARLCQKLDDLSGSWYSNLRQMALGATHYSDRWDGVLPPFKWSDRGRGCTAGQDPKLIFACPDCDTKGWVHWARLPRGMRCGSCGGRFWIDSGGHIRSERQASKVRFECPRCRRVEVVPKELLARGIVCGSCEQRFHYGPDGHFHTRSELDKLRRQETKTGKLAEIRRPGWLERLWRRPAVVSVPYRVAAALAIVLLTGLLISGIVQLTGALGGPTSLENSVEAFTRLCVEGRAAEAAEFSCSDQQDALGRWLAICYAGRQPSGNSADSARRVDHRPRVEVDITDESSDVTQVRRLMSARPTVGLRSVSAEGHPLVWVVHANRLAWDSSQSLHYRLPDCTAAPCKTSLAIMGTEIEYGRKKSLQHAPCSGIVGLVLI